MLPTVLACLAAACATDVTASVKVQRDYIRWNEATRRGVQRIAIWNISSKPLTGPLSLVVDELGILVSLHNRTGETECIEPRGQLIDLKISGKSLAPGATAAIMLEFDGPKSSIDNRYRARVLAGNGAR